MNWQEWIVFITIVIVLGITFRYFYHSILRLQNKKNPCDSCGLDCSLRRELKNKNKAHLHPKCDSKHVERKKKQK
jgi:hypothetical protein